MRLPVLMRPWRQPDLGAPRSATTYAMRSMYTEVMNPEAVSWCPSYKRAYAHVFENGLTT